MQNDSHTLVNKNSRLSDIVFSSTPPLPIPIQNQKKKKENRRNPLQRTKVSENIKLHKKPTANDICAPNIINNATDERFELRFTKRENGDH